MPNFSKGKIYKLVSNKSSDVYIGSCIIELSKRLSNHKSKSNECVSKSMFINDAIISIVLIEDYPCENKNQLKARELHYITNINCININKPFISDIQIINGDNKEWRICAGELHLVVNLMLLAVLCRLGMLRLCHGHEFFSSWYGRVSGNRRRAATSQRSAGCFVIALATSVGVRVLTHEHTNFFWILSDQRLRAAAFVHEAAQRGNTAPTSMPSAPPSTTQPSTHIITRAQPQRHRPASPARELATTCARKC